jgi:hypothetical protein
VDFAAITERQKSAGVIVVRVAENNVGDRGEIDLERRGVAPDDVVVRAGVEEEAVAIGLDERGEAPFADAAAIGQHRGENGDLEGFDLRGRGVRGGRGVGGEGR